MPMYCTNIEACFNIVRVGMSW